MAHQPATGGESRTDVDGCMTNTCMRLGTCLRHESEAKAIQTKGGVVLESTKPIVVAGRGLQVAAAACGAKIVLHYKGLRIVLYSRSLSSALICVMQPIMCSSLSLFVNSFSLWGECETDVSDNAEKGETTWSDSTSSANIPAGYHHHSRSGSAGLKSVQTVRIA